MDEEPAVAEIPSVSEVDADYVETEDAKLIELKPVSYDVDDLANNKSDVFDKMDIDNHNVDFEQDDGTIASEDDPVDHRSDPNIVTESEESKDSVPKVNGMLKYSKAADKADTKSLETSPNATPGKSRYGRVRKPKLSTDFISVDRKSFAVLSNTSSYEHVYADDTPRTPVAKIKQRKSAAKVSKVTPPKEDQSPKSLTKQSTEKVIDIEENLSTDEKDPPKPVKISSNTPKAVKTVTQTPKVTRSKQPKTPKPAKEDSVEPSTSSLASKDTIKTYSRKGETSASANASEDDQSEKVADEEKQSQISHVELSWKVGDVAWAKIGCYSYWPSIVTLEYGSSIYVKSGWRFFSFLVVIFFRVLYFIIFFSWKPKISSSRTVFW